MKKHAIGLILTGGLLCTSAFASTGSLSLSEQLQSGKNILETQIKSLDTKFHAEYQRLVTPEKLTAEYQSLRCLGVIQEDALLTQIEAELALLKKNMLLDYVRINAEIFNLLNQYSVGLINDTVYITQYEKLKLDTDAFLQTHKATLTNAEQKYLQRIFTFLESNKQYVSQNDELLSYLNQKILKIQNTISQFQTLEEGIFEINNALNLYQGNFLDTIQSTRNGVITMLDTEISNRIARYDRRYTKDPELKNIYLAKKHEIMSTFTMALDSEINHIIGSRYNPSQYSYAKEQIGIIGSTFYEGSQINCEKVLTTQVDLGGYVDTVEQSVKQLRADVEKAIITLSQTGVDHKTQLYNSFKTFYTTHYTTELQGFKTFVQNKTASSQVGSTTTTTNTAPQISTVAPSYIFDRPFTKGETHIGVKHLQELLTKLGHYKYNINSNYDANTTEAVYKFQIAKGILKGLSGETAQGYLGPATRTALNQEMQKRSTEKATTTPTITPPAEATAPIKAQIPVSQNPFVALLYKMEAKYSSKDAFKALMYKAQTQIALKASDDTLPITQKMLFENIKEAIDIYLTTNP